MRIDNNGLEEMECPSCSKTDLVVTNELFFNSECLNVDFECTSCDKKYERDYEALIAGFNDCEDFPHLPQEEFNLNEDEEGERFEIGTCYNCGSKDVWESGDPFLERTTCMRHTFVKIANWKRMSSSMIVMVLMK